MKLVWTLIASLIMTMGLVSTADAGKKFGSGGFGKTYNTTPYKAAPQQSPQKQQPAQAAPANNSRKGLMGGLLGGLLAGGLFAYLLGSGAFEGLQFMDILLFALVAFVLFKLFRRKAPQAQAREAWAGQGAGLNVPPAPGVKEPAASAFSNVSGVRTDVPMNLPEGFDAQSFTEGALSHFREVQDAWNKGDLNVIREYVAPELFDALARQRERMMVPPQTEILDLNAEIVRADRNGDIAEISVLFRGRVKDDLEKSEDGVYDVWHLERDLSANNAPWVIVGIEAD
ncbi:Tim44 domain-containing protein [Thalassolituus sp. LLYu03]|uniref:Tim44 domain-containing protein n=1 Tax=Thalassolituus sp. LLYu03 TaxID=3421656 RepID=UPI003D2E78B4